jgi:hypothetical protein
MALLYLQNRDSKVVSLGDYVKYAPSSTKGFLYALLGEVDIIGNATEKIYPGKWGYINPLNNWDGLVGLPAYPFPFQQVVFANPLNLNASYYKDFICASITNDTTINLNNVVNGDAGMIELIIDAVGGYTITLGAMFTKKLGTNNINTDANKDNFISYRMSGSDIVYTINTV